MNPLDPQIQPHRPSLSSTTCDLHPDEQFSGFCPLCLYERLSLLNPASSQPKPTTTNAIKSFFKSSTTNSFPPELRRTKSFSVSNREGFSGAFEPQRKSCDVRGRNSLYCLFNQADERKSITKKEQPQPVAAVEVEVENGIVDCSSSSSLSGGLVDCDVYESKRDGRDESSQEGEIRVCDEQRYNNVVNVVEDKNNDIETVLKVKTMKDHIDLDSHNKKGSTRDFKEIAGSLLSVASGFSKKLQKWRQDQKMKKGRNGARASNLPVEKSIGRQYRETQSEIADYGFGRRSCDTDPRFSLDAGRMSFDEPRVSWDGHMVGKTFSRMAPMLSVEEDDAPVHIPRSDTEIPVEQPPILMNRDDAVPGGSAQTRDYYLDSSSKRRKSLDRSSSLRKTTATVMAQNEEIKPVSNARVSPDDCAETFKTGFRYNASIMDNDEKKEPNKKSSRWSKAFNIWGLIQRRSGLKDEDEDEDRFKRTNGVEPKRSFSESWQDVRIEHNGDARGDFNRKIFRSNSSVSWRNSNGFEGSTSFRSSSVRKNNVEMNGHGKTKRDEFMFERNRSARYSPNHAENGLLRFHLNPLSSNWRSTSTGKSRSNHTHSIARSVLRLY